MPVTDGYIEYVLDQLSCLGEIAHKRMFGGLAIYYDGTYFALVDDDILYFKVDDQTRPRYLAMRSHGFDPYKDGRPSTGSFSVPASVLEDQDQLSIWAREAIGAAHRKSSSKRAAKKPATPAAKKAPSTKAATKSAKKPASSKATKRKPTTKKRR